MCICINCEHVNNCTIYLYVETQHNQIPLNKNPYFTPKSTIISANLRSHNKEYLIEWDIIECLSFAESPGKWIQLIEY